MVENTASRSVTISATQFAVVNTKDNLEVTLAADGTIVTVDNGADKEVNIASGKTLTDASFDHTVAAANIVVPDADGKKVGKFDFHRANNEIESIIYE